jgi:hypothetical protein
MNPSTRRTLLIGLLVLVIICCLCVTVLGVISAAFGIWTTVTEVQSETIPLSTPAGPTPMVVRPTAQATSDPSLEETLRTLEETLVPINDLRDIARRLEGKDDIPLTLPSTNIPLEVGTQQTFWATNVETNENFQVTATLRYVTDHLYFWIENDVNYNERDLRDLAETFENSIYPTNRTFFGSEWSPGVDEDPHLYVLYASGLGSSLAGYFSSVDEYHPLAHEYSNGHEMFLLNVDTLDLDETFTYSVLAHEFQHMIHWYRDRNEESWLNEGFSELAAFLNGYDLGGFDYAYTADPDLQLNDWPNDPSQTTPHYGASFLYLTYFLDRYGDEATQALVSHDKNGMVSVDAVLEEIDAFDPKTGQAVRADDVFLDWVLASYLQDEEIEDGRYTYTNYPAAPRPEDTEEIDDCPTDVQTRDASQYGVDYVRIDCEGEFTLRFEGSTRVRVVPADPYSGDYAFWSNKGDESDMTLTKSFDFRDEEGPITLTYWTWYDVEEDYDYLYLEASTDGGESWEILITPSGTSEDPTGNSYGWAYNGLSGGGPEWIQEEVDLSPFAGEQVLIRFEYITDAAVNGEGFLIDDVAVPEVGYATDFETDDGGWEAAGFVRIQNALPQTYRLALISEGDTTTVTPLELDENNTIEISLALGEDPDEVVLVIAPTTRFTRQSAAYRFEITP